MELQGIACGGLVESEPKQSIMSSKSFGAMQTEFSSVAQSISSHCARAVEKLRPNNRVAQRMVVFVHTNRFREDLAQYCKSIEVRFINPTDDLRIITKFAKRCLRRIFKEGYFYKKAGICLEDLIPKDTRQLDFFHQPSEEALQKTEHFMGVLDSINQKFGRQTIVLAAEGYSKPWAMRAQLKSQLILRDGRICLESKCYELKDDSTCSSEAGLDILWRVASSLLKKELQGSHCTSVARN
jgi:DNA polymerase V